MEITSLSKLFEILEDASFQVDRRYGWLLFRGQPIDKPLLPRIARSEFDQQHIGYIEKELIYLFKRKALPFIQHEPQDDWEWLAVAQHHGLPTRLLDWTFNPLAALWFTVTVQPKSSESGVFYAYWPSKKDRKHEMKGNPLKLKEPTVFRPKNIAQRITSQSGAFIAFARNQKGFLPLSNWHPSGSKLKKFKVPVSSFSFIRSQLDRNAINSSTIYQDLDGLAKHLSWQFSAVD